jgi:hypothetical protein
MLQPKKVKALTSQRDKGLPMMVAGVHYEALQTERTRESEIVELTFTTQGTALVPMRGVRGAAQALVPRMSVLT